MLNNEVKNSRFEIGHSLFDINSLILLLKVIAIPLFEGYLAPDAFF